jgi:hypothetical protein
MTAAQRIVPPEGGEGASCGKSQDLTVVRQNVVSCFRQCFSIGFVHRGSRQAGHSRSNAIDATYHIYIDTPPRLTLNDGAPIFWGPITQP